MRPAAFLLVCLLAAGCREVPEHQKAAMEYVKANRAADCEAAWDLLSRATQEHYRQRLARTPLDPITRRRLRLQDMYCSPGMYKEWDLDSIHVRHYAAGQATIGFRSAVYSGFGGPFFPRKKSWRDVDLTVIREGNRWVILDRDLLPR